MATAGLDIVSFIFFYSRNVGCLGDTYQPDMVSLPAVAELRIN
jgi:hypothetical protein